MSEVVETGSDGRIVTEKRGRIFIIKLDRPKKLNGQNPYPSRRFEISWACGLLAFGKCRSTILRSEC